MNIFQYVQKMEKDGEAYYRELAEKCNDKGLRTIFLNMADDEVKHFHIFKEMEANADPEMVNTEILQSSRNVFEQMREQNEEHRPDLGQIEAYRNARQIELDSEAFYLEKAKEVDSETHKDLFVRIAEEEKKHAFLLENVIDFVTKPDNWLENAEHHHLEEF